MDVKIEVDVMTSGAIVMHAEDSMAIVGIKIPGPEDARRVAKALMAAADLTEAER